MTKELRADFAMKRTLNAPPIARIGCLCAGNWKICGMGEDEFHVKRNPAQSCSCETFFAHDYFPLSNFRISADPREIRALMSGSGGFPPTNGGQNHPDRTSFFCIGDRFPVMGK
jgi:hypothetical protein